MAAGQMEITLELKYKFEGDPFELREHAVKFDLTNRALGGPSSGNVEYIISKSDSEIETHLQHPPEEGVQFQIRHRTFEGLKHAESLLSSLVQRVRSDFDKMKKAVGVSEKAWIVIYEPVTVHCGCCGRKRKGTIGNLEQHFRSHLEKEFNMLAVRVSRLPPETTKKDVTDTFGNFGEITNIRRVQVPSDVRDRCAVLEYKSPNAVDSIINKDQAEAISIRGSKLLISRVKKGEEMLPPPAPPPPTPAPTQKSQRNQGSQRPVTGTYRQNTAPLPLNLGMTGVNFEQLKDKPEVVAHLIGLFTAHQNQSNVGADGAAFADEVKIVLQQAFQAPQEGASAAAGGPGDFTRKRAGVEMPGGTPKRQRQEFTPFASEQEHEQGEFSGYGNTRRGQDEMGTPSSAKGKKSSQGRLDALRQSIANEEKESTQKKVQFKGSKKQEPPAVLNRDEDVDDADDFVDDGGGSPMEQDNGPEFSGDGGETAKVETPKPVNYEPRQVHVSGFSLVTNQEDLVSALTSEYGKISDCKMHRKAFKTQVTRFAVVEFEEESSVKKILGSKNEIVSNVGRYRLTITRIAMESQDNEQSSGGVIKSANTESESTSAEKKEYSPEIVEEQKLTVKVVTSLIELVDRTTFPEKTESVDKNMMKKLNNDQLTVAKDLHRANRHRTITRMAYILNALKGIDDEPRVAHTLYLWDRKILSKQFFHEPKDAGLLHIVQELEPAVQQALKTSAKYNPISLYRKIASIVNFVVDKKELDEEKAFAARGVKFRSKSGKQGQGGGSFLRDEVDHPEDVPKYLDLHKGPDEVHEFDTVLGDDADVEFTGNREPQGLVGDVSIRSKKIGERKLTLNSPPDMAVKSARKIILQKMDEDNKMLSRPLSMLVKHTIQMCIHKIIAVLYYRHRKVINKFQQEDLTSQLIRQELKRAGKTPIEEPSRPIELSGVRYEKKKPPSAKVSSMQEEPTSIEPDEPMEQDEQKISPYAPPPEMATVSGPKDFQTFDEYPEEIQHLVVKWKKSVRYNEMHTKEQYTAIKKLKMELSQANRLIINKKMGTINQENYTREETVDLRLCMIFEVKHKLEEKKKEKYEQKMKKAKMEKEKKKHKKDKEKEREKEKPKPKKHVLALSSTSSDSDSDLDLPKKTPPKTSQQTPHKEKHKIDLVPEGKTDTEVKRKLIAEKKEKEPSVVKSEPTEKETVKKETEGEKATIEKAEKSEPQSTSQKSKMQSSDKNSDLREADEEDRGKEDQNKKVAVKSEASTPEKATESRPTKTETMKSKEIHDSGDNIFQKLSKDFPLKSKDFGEDKSKSDSSKDVDAEVKQSGNEINQSDSCPVISDTDKPESVPKVSQNDEVTAGKDAPPEKEEAPVLSESRSRSVSRSSSSSGSSGRSPSKSRSRSRSVSRASSRSSRASSRSGSRASSNSGSRASSRSGSRASSGSRSSSRGSSRSGSNASSRSRSGGSAKSQYRSRSNSGSRSGSGSRAASPSRSRSRSKSSSVPRSRSVSNASSRSNSRSVSRSRSRSKSSSRSRSRSRSNSRSSSAASVKSASGSDSSDEDRNVEDTSENKEESTTKSEGKDDSEKKLEGKDITNAGNEAKKDTLEGDQEVQDDREVERKASPVQNIRIGSPERVEEDKIVASDSSGPGSPKYPSSSSEAEVKDPGGDERSIDTEMQEVIEQVINLQEQMGMTGKEASTTVQDSNEGKQNVTESEAAPKETTEVEMQEVTPEPTLEDDIRDAEISMEAPPEPEQSTAPAAVDDDDDDSSDDEDDSYETDSSSLITGSPAASLQVTGFIELTKEEASKAFYEELTSEQRRFVYKELERNVRIQKKVGIPYTHEEKSAIKTQLIGKYLKIQREDPNSKGEILTNLEKKELKRLKKEERKRHKKKRRKEKDERRSGSDGRSPMPMRSPRELPAQYMDLPAQYADPTPDEILEANLSDGDNWRQRNKERSGHRESDSHRSDHRESYSHRPRDRDDRREHNRTPRARRGGGWNSRGHSSSSRGSGSSHRWERDDRRRSPNEGRRYRDDHRDKGNYHDSRRQQRW